MKHHLDSPVSKAFGVRSVAADVGVEVELEYKNTLEPAVIDTSNWVSVPDGSLRHGMEYKLSKPIRAREIDTVIDQLFRNLPSKDNLLISPRTSVHLHVNMTKRTMRELMNVYSGYLLFENMLFATQIGRKSNHFCLRTIDAETVYNRVLNGLKEQNIPRFFHGDDVRYSGLNFNALPKYGSIEYRFLGGMADAEPMKLWSTGLHNMTDQLASISAQDQLALASTGLDALGAKVFTPELAKIVMPMFEKLSEPERMSGFGYATGLSVALDAVPTQETEPCPYVFDSNPDIDITAARAHKKKKGSIFGFDIDPAEINAGWNEPPRLRPRRPALTRRPGPDHIPMEWWNAWHTGIQMLPDMSDNEANNFVDRVYRMAVIDAERLAFTNDQLAVYRLLAQVWDNGNLGALWDYRDNH